MKVTAEDDRAFPVDAVQVYLRRARVPDKRALAYVNPAHLELLRRHEGRTLVVTLRTAPVIRLAFPRPYGFYLVTFELKDADGATATHNMSFGYVMSQEQLGSATWLFNDTSFLQQQKTRVFKYAPGDGLRINPYSRRGGFVSADLAKAFDFTSDFCIWGRFTIAHADPNSPSALDIGFCDRRGERVAAILGDGGSTRFSLKTVDDEFDDESVNVNTALSGKAKSRIMADGHTQNHFCVCVRRHNASSSLWSLYVSRNEADPDRDFPAHYRLIPNHFISKGPLSLNLKAWRRGTVTLSCFNVAELPQEYPGLADAGLENALAFAQTSTWPDRSDRAAGELGIGGFWDAIPILPIGSPQWRILSLEPRGAAWAAMSTGAFRGTRIHIVSATAPRQPK